MALTSRNQMFLYIYIYYIYDSLCMNQDFDCCQKDTTIITDKLYQLGFTINQEKSVLIPCQGIVFFGVIIDTAEFNVYLTTEKIENIKN